MSNYNASILKTTTVVLLCIFLALPVFAGNQAGKVESVEGIIAIKEGHGDILIRPDNGNDKRLRVRGSTSITRNGKSATYDDLQARDRVEAKYGSDRVVIELNATGS
jgi:hypothetical protein